MLVSYVACESLIKYNMFLLQSANITKYLISLLGTETSEKVQALLCIGISKLVLSGMITDVEVSIFIDFIIADPDHRCFVGCEEPRHGVPVTYHCR